MQFSDILIKQRAEKFNVRMESNMSDSYLMICNNTILYNTAFVQHFLYNGYIFMKL